MHSINRPSILAHNHRDMPGDDDIDAVDDVDVNDNANDDDDDEQVSAKPKEYASWITGSGTKANPQW